MSTLYGSTVDGDHLDLVSGCHVVTQAHRNVPGGLSLGVPFGLVSTTVGRVLFNDILNAKMAFYDLSLSSKHLSRIIADCYQKLGRRQTIELLQDLDRFPAWRSGRLGHVAFLQ